MAIGTQIGFATFTAAVCALSAVSIATGRETFKRPTAELGRTTNEARAHAPA